MASCNLQCLCHTTERSCALSYSISLRNVICKRNISVVCQVCYGNSLTHLVITRLNWGRKHCILRFQVYWLIDMT